MAQCDAIKGSDVRPNDMPALKSHFGFVDFWDGPVTQDRASNDKIKWKKRYLVMQTIPSSFLQLLVYRKKKKTADAPMLKFTLSDETSTICFGPTFKNKYTFDVSVRIGRLFMRYRFGVETEEIRNKWLHKLVTSYILHPHTPLNLTYLVTPITTPQVTKLSLSGVSYLLLFKGYIELCRLSDHARLGKWPISAVHSYTTDKNVFTVKFKPNSMYGEVEIPFCSKNTIEIFRILNSLITTGEFPPGQAPGIKRPRVQKLFSQLPDMISVNGEIPDSPIPYHSLTTSPQHKPTPKRDLKVHISKSNPGQSNLIYTVDNPRDVESISPQFHTIQHPHSPERRGGYKGKKNRVKSMESEQAVFGMIHYDQLNHFHNLNKAQKGKDPLRRTPDVMAVSDVMHPSNSTGNIPTIYSTVNQTKNPIDESPYSVANFHRFPGWKDSVKLFDQMLVRSSSDQNVFESPSKTIYEQLPLTKANSLDNILIDDFPNESVDFNPYAIVNDHHLPPQRPLPATKVPPPPPFPLQFSQPNGYESVTLPVRGGKLRGVKKSPSIDDNINFGNFHLEESRQWVRETNYKLDDIHEN